MLFGACGVAKCGDEQCSTPVVSIPYASTCIYHTPVPNPIVSRLGFAVIYECMQFIVSVYDWFLLLIVSVCMIGFAVHNECMVCWW